MEPNNEIDLRGLSGRAFFFGGEFLGGSSRVRSEVGAPLTIIYIMPVSQYTCPGRSISTNLLSMVDDLFVESHAIGTLAAHCLAFSHLVPEPRSPFSMKPALGVKPDSFLNNFIAFIE